MARMLRATAAALRAVAPRSGIVGGGCRVASSVTPLRRFVSAANATPGLFPFDTEETGQPGTTDWRMYFTRNGERVSPWFDIPLRAGPLGPHPTFNFVAEIPRGATAKMEVTGDEEHHPIMQDTNKDGSVRHYHGASIVNYGALPQTWEDPSHKDEDTGFLGDGDPLDVVEISQLPCQVGDVYAVRVLGVLGMIDEGEMDWKLVCINAADPLAAELPDVTDPAFPADLSTYVADIREWFETYKIPDGKPRNVFAFDGQPQSAEYAMKVIDTTHNMWRNLRNQSG